MYDSTPSTTQDGPGDTGESTPIRRLVIGYDGSGCAKHALDFAAARFERAAAVVVHVASMPLPAGSAMVPLAPPVVTAPEVEAELDRLARDTAEDGVARAARAGLDAEAEIRHGAGSSAIAARLLDVAEERDADLVVVGRRDLGTVEALLRSSVSSAALHDGRRPVLVVPSRE